MKGQGLGALFAPKKQSKYRAKPVMIDGIWFPSKLEGSRWLELRMLEKAGEVSNLTRQINFRLCVNGILIGDYRADFVYLRNGERIIEDAKGIITQMCRWKLKHMAAQGDKVSLWPPRKTKAKKGDK